MPCLRRTPGSVLSRVGLCVLPLLFPNETTARQGEPDVRAERVPADGRINVDGSLDEPAWAQAIPATGFRQREPFAGEAATEITEVRILYDDETIFVGVNARDRFPNNIISRILERDRVMETGFNGLQFGGDDAVAIIFDPFHDHRNGVIFATNPNGAEFDALLTDEGREINLDWRGVWSVASARTSEGWVAEFAIPLRTLRYPAESSEPWGFNVYRVIRRKNEEVLWHSWSRNNEGFERVSRAGHLHGLGNLPRLSANLEVKPYLLGGQSRELVDGTFDDHLERDAGVDVKYEVRPGLLLDVTANTDFAQVEADDEQVNLTRFSLFFPEKRDFFLENAGIFEFGWRSFFEPPPFLLFFSRQIGIADEEVAPVIGGARLTGRVGGQTVGFMNIVTDEAFGEPRTNFGVARLKRDVGASSYIGTMITDRRGGGVSNTAAGIDASFWPSSALNVQGFAAATTTSEPGGEGLAYRLGLDYQTDRFGITAGHLGITEGATADLGFVTRTNILRNDAFARFTPRPDVLGLRKIDLYWNVQAITRTDLVLQDWQVGPAVGPEWSSGDGVTFFYIIGQTVLDESFDISDDVEIPAGTYPLRQLGWFANSSRNRPLVFSSQGMLQWIYDGTVHSVMSTLDATPSANLAVRLGLTRNLVNVPNGSFDADIVSLRLALALSTKLFANALIQYNDQDDELSANVRFNFIHRPGSDLFVVFNERRGTPGDLWGLDSRAALAKLTYLARF